jgi:16S rRNA G527 N7-methylase RsmG
MSLVGWSSGHSLLLEGFFESFSTLTFIILEKALRCSGPFRVLDVGSGAGILSFVMSFFCEGVYPISCEVSYKKILFQAYVKQQLNITNLLITRDLNSYQAVGVDVIVSRACVVLSKIVSFISVNCVNSLPFICFAGCYPYLILKKTLYELNFTGINVVKAQIWMLNKGRYVIVIRYSVDVDGLVS